MARPKKAKEQATTTESFWGDIVKALKDDNTTFASDRENSAEFSGFFDTGSYMFNALVSGSLFGGLQNNKVTMFAGESSVGKTYYAIAIIKAFLNDHPNAAVFYYDTESAVTTDMLESRGVDAKRVIKVEPLTMQQFRTHVMRVLENYEAVKGERPPMLMVLDSLGALSTTKELEDISTGSDKRDMTRAQLIRGTFRAIRLKLSRLGVPMLLTNHVYEVVGAYIPTKEISGGGGSKYAADNIVSLSKKKDRDEKTKAVVGNIITARMHKARLSKENQTVDTRLNYNRGLDRYYGLLDFAIECGIVNKGTDKGEKNDFIFPDGQVASRKEIEANGAKYFDQDILNQLEPFANAQFRYGGIMDGEEELVQELANDQ